MRTPQEPAGGVTRITETGERVNYTPEAPIVESPSGAEPGAEQRAEQLRERTASGLHSAAQTLRQQGAEAGRGSLANRAAEPLDRGAQYLGSHSWTQIRSDVTEQAQEHPLWAAAGVFTTAFLVGRLLRRR